MRIALVDDIASELKRLRHMLDIQLARLALDAEISEFCSGKMFLSVAPKKMFDLVFLDIYMEDINGVDTAKELRCFNADCLLVFITSSMEHALDAFRVRAFHYLVKPYKDEELTKLFDEIIHRFPVQDRYIEVKASGSIVRLRFQDILYAEHYQHQIHIYQTNNQKRSEEHTSELQSH